MLYGEFLSLRLVCGEVRAGFSIPLNTFGSGLSIARIGPIIFSPYARIGKTAGFVLA